MSGVTHLPVDPDEAGQRLDRWFRKRFPHVPQGMIARLCRKGAVRLDGGRVRPDTRIEAGQTVRVPPLPDAEDRDRRAPAPALSDADARMLQAAVIYRDADILALNKPPGLAVQGGSGQVRHLDAMAAALRFEADAAPRLVHRLDRDTSGVLVMARTGRAARGLARAFHDRQTRKIYWAAVAGCPQPRRGTIRLALAKAPGAVEKMVAVAPDRLAETAGARQARTDYVVIEAAARRAAWVALQPVTGRTHQLRVHMAAIGHPVAGDGKYGTHGQTNDGAGWGAQLGGGVSRKLHLHARRLRLRHPVTGAWLDLTAPLPAHMRRTWDLFGWSPADAPADPFEDAP